MILGKDNNMTLLPYILSMNAALHKLGIHSSSTQVYRTIAHPPVGTPPKQIMQATLIVESLTKEYYFYLAAVNVNGSFRNI